MGTDGPSPPGLSPLVVHDLFEIIRDHAYVFEHGKVTTEGEAREARGLESVREAHLRL